jgi:hypothetical protein
VARKGLVRDRASADFYQGKIAACRYFFANEVTRIPQLCNVCLTDTSFVEARPEWL